MVSIEIIAFVFFINSSNITISLFDNFPTTFFLSLIISLVEKLLEKVLLPRL